MCCIYIFWNEKKLKTGGYKIIKRYIKLKYNKHTRIQLKNKNYKNFAFA